MYVIIYSYWIEYIGKVTYFSFFVISAFIELSIVQMYTKKKSYPRIEQVQTIDLPRRTMIK